MFFLWVLLVLVFITVLDRDGNISEFRGVFFSTVSASIFWIFFQKFIHFQSLGKRIKFWLNILFVLKIITNLVHFYFLFAPASGITTAVELPSLFFSGDLLPIHYSAEIFMRERGNFGLWSAVFGDYYRGINNPGVGVIYGLLYGCFGPYAPAAIPWNALAMALSSSLIGAICELLYIDRRAICVAMILTYIMPGYFITPPIYRDQFILLFILLTTFSGMDFFINNRLSSLIVMLPCALVLNSLRDGYLILPLVLVLAMILIPHKRGPSFKVKVMASVLSIVVILLMYNFLLDKVFFWISRIYGMTIGYSTLDRMPTTIPVIGYFIRFGFILLNPMPWWQSIEKSLFVYQVFSYPQTILSLSVIAGLVLGYRYILDHKELFPLLLVAFCIFHFAVVGSSLAAGYTQTGLPLLIIAASPIMLRQWRKCIWVGTGLILVAHVLYLLV